MKDITNEFFQEEIKRAKRNCIIAAIFFIAVILFSGCAPVFENYQPHRHNEHLRGTPRYGAHDTVYDFRNQYVFVIDSVSHTEKKHPGQTFYCAHYLNGVSVNWLPESSIVKFKKDLI